jgi:SAM-dependent methyltransferase
MKLLIPKRFMTSNALAGINVSEYEDAFGARQPGHWRCWMRWTCAPGSGFDIATGPGYVAAAAVRAEHGSWASIFPRQWSLSARANPAIEFQEGDAEELFPMPASMQWVMNFRFFTWRARTAMTQAARVLKPGGRFASPRGRSRRRPSDSNILNAIQPMATRSAYP